MPLFISTMAPWNYCVVFLFINYVLNNIKLSPQCLIITVIMTNTKQMSKGVTSFISKQQQKSLTNARFLNMQHQCQFSFVICNWEDFLISFLKNCSVKVSPVQLRQEWIKLVPWLSVIFPSTFQRLLLPVKSKVQHSRSILETPLRI